MNSNNKNGLELIRAMVAGELPKPTMADTIPMRFVEAKEGYVKFQATAGPEHLNPMGGVHGGFAATVLDSVTGCAVHTTLEAGVAYGTVDLAIKMLKPLPQNEELMAEGKVLHVSKNIGVSEGTLKNADGVLLAHATSTCYIKR